MKTNITQICHNVTVFLCTLLMGTFICFGIVFCLTMLFPKKSDVQKNEELFMRIMAAHFNVAQTNWDVIIVPRTNN